MEQNNNGAIRCYREIDFLNLTTENIGVVSSIHPKAYINQNL